MSIPAAQEETIREMYTIGWSALLEAFRVFRDKTDALDPQNGLRYAVWDHIIREVAETHASVASETGNPDVTRVLALKAVIAEATRRGLRG